MQPPPATTNPLKTDDQIWATVATLTRKVDSSKPPTKGWLRAYTKLLTQLSDYTTLGGSQSTDYRTLIWGMQHLLRYDCFDAIPPNAHRLLHENPIAIDSILADVIYLKLNQPAEIPIKKWLTYFTLRELARVVESFDVRADPAGGLEITRCEMDGETTGEYRHTTTAVQREALQNWRKLNIEIATLKIQQGLQRISTKTEVKNYRG